MNPVKAIEDLGKAVTFPFTSLFVVGLCAFINWFTSPGHWWFQWVAFGMTIALICIWARALKILFVAAGVAGIGYLFYRWRATRSQSKQDSAVAANSTR